jgi:hypothetical protein
MTQMTHPTALYVGIDVSQNTLTIALYPTDRAADDRQHQPTPTRPLLQHLAHTAHPAPAVRQAQAATKKRSPQRLQQAGLPVRGRCLPSVPATSRTSPARRPQDRPRQHARDVGVLCLLLPRASPLRRVFATVPGRELKALWSASRTPSLRATQPWSAKRSVWHPPSRDLTAVRASLAANACRPQRRDCPDVRRGLPSCNARRTRRSAQGKAASVARRAEWASGAWWRIGLVAELPDLASGVSTEAIAALGGGWRAVRCESGDWVASGACACGVRRRRVRRLL